MNRVLASIAPQETGHGLIRLSAGTVASEKADDAQDYLERVRAYIPTPVVGFFIFVNSLTLGKALTASVKVEKDTVIFLTADAWVALGALVLGGLATILLSFIASRDKGTRTWTVHAAVSTLAFAAWAYAIGARAFEVLHIPVVPSVAGALLATFTLFSGLIIPVDRPVKMEPDPQPQSDREPQTDPDPAPAIWP